MAIATDPATGKTHSIPEAGAAALASLGWEVELPENVEDASEKKPTSSRTRGTRK